MSEEEKTPKGRSLTPKEWAEAEALWESGEVTIQDLVDRFGRSKAAFSRHFQKHGIEKGAAKEAHKKAVAQAVTSAAVDESVIVAARIKETKEEHYKMAAGLSKLVWSELLQAKSAGKEFALVQGNLKSLDIAASALKKLREERWAILGMDKEGFVDEDYLPELVINELTAEQIEELRNRDDSGLDDEVIQAEDTQGDPDDNDVVEEGDD